MKILSIILAALLDIVPGGPAFLNPLGSEKDTVRVADQFEYGFVINNVQEGTSLALPDLKGLPADTLSLVRDWKVDTLRAKDGGVSLKASVVVAPFEEGEMMLPPLSAVRINPDGKADTLQFDPSTLDVVPLQVDTATFQVKNLKAQIKYPVTFKELLPWIGGALLLAAIVVLVIFLVKKFGKKGAEKVVSSDPAYIVALRELEKYRGDALWAPDKQKQFYSGITDALKVYMEDRYSIDAPEMTTAELFSALKKELGADLYEPLKEMFEEADFVKFAKHFSSNETLAKVLPLAMGFVTSTYIKPQEEVKA